MALINCPECKKKISETASKCPNCGYKIKANKIKHNITKNNIYVITVFIIIFVIVISISNYSKKDNNNTLTTTTTETISKNYYDIINNLSLLKKEIVIIGDIKLNLDIDETISGYKEQSSEIKKVIIKDNKIYEINNGIETLSDLIDDASYLNPTELIKYLLNNKSIKTTENNNNIYKYNDLTVYVENEKITKVVFNNGYEINYN